MQGYQLSHNWKGLCLQVGQARDNYRFTELVPCLSVEGVSVFLSASGFGGGGLLFYKTDGSLDKGHEELRPFGQSPGGCWDSRDAIQREEVKEEAPLELINLEGLSSY